MTAALRLALLLVLVPVSVAQVSWEQLPLLGPYNSGTRANNLAFLGGASNELGLVWMSTYGPLRYTPGDPANGEWGDDWDSPCDGRCHADAGIVTPEGTILIGATAGVTAIDRFSSDGTWETKVAGDGYSTTTLFQTSLPALQNAQGHGAILGGNYSTLRSDDDGRRGSWRLLGPIGGDLVAYGEVPPSPALPDGRLLAGVYNGVTLSDDGGATWAPGRGAYGFARYIAQSFAFLPEPGHPYGGTVLAGIDDLAFCRDSTATV